ncbi:hypothetical protein DIS24_g4669 [Lasiodiplodia hormozganensis]|uniref:Uncharacterized protein n=1 Tax=Lasiodiplodia hormozganensis TaxID=869390 RepID=A0AA39YUQ4_9PEZI|nr:hypothetical protein DIS24_g4669 [Lasiodiplodia hormozganensis]
MDSHQRERLRRHQATPTDVTEEQRKLTGPNSAFINCIRDTIRATPGTYESIVQLLLSMEPEIREAASDTNSNSPRSEWSSVTMVAPRSPMQELPRATRLVPGVFLGSYTNTYVPGPVYTNCDWTGTMPSFEQWQTVVEYDDRMDVDVASSSHSVNGGGEGSVDANLEASSVHQTEEQEQYELMEIEMDIDAEEQQSEDQQQRPGEQQHAEEQQNAEEQQYLEEGQHQQEEQPEEQPEEQQSFHPQPSPTAAQPNEHAKEQHQQQQEEQQDEEPVGPQPSRPQHSPTAAQSNKNAEEQHQQQNEEQQEEEPVHPQPSPTDTQSNEQAAPASQPSAQPALPAPDFLADPFAGTESRTNQFIRSMGEAAMLIRELRYGRDYVQSGALFPSTSCEGYQEFRRRLEAGMRMSPHNSMKKCFDEVEICLEMIVDCLVVAQVLEMVQNWSAWGVNPLG